MRSEKSMGNQNKRKNPFIICDKCIEIRNSILNKDFEAFLKATNRFEAYKKATDMNNNNADTQLQPLLLIQEAEMAFKSPIYSPSKCPFDYNPPLNRAIRVKYRLKCLQCGDPIPCPAHKIQYKYPICADCQADYFDSSCDTYDENY